MSAPVPPVAVDVSDAYVLVITPANILLYERASGKLLSALDANIDPGANNAERAAFPRFAAISPDESYVAVTGDDKGVRVWRPTDMRYGAEVLHERLPKRAGTMRWAPCQLENGDSSYEVVLADKFGDIWSFPVDPSKACGAPPAAQAAKNEADEEDDESAVPRLGHVSMVTAVDFLGQGVPSMIVTADRDEHIRISRWGTQRLGYVIEQYLLGTRGAVGALAVLSPETGARAALGVDGEAIISADGGEGLRLWSQQDGMYSLHSSLALDRETLAATVVVDADVERRRERAANNMAFRGTFDPEVPAEKRQKRAGDGDSALTIRSEGHVVIITKVIPHMVNGRDWLVFTLDGANAFFTIALDELRGGRDSPVAKESIRVHGVGAPVLDVAVKGSSVWVVCDDRPAFGSGVAPLQRFEWTEDGAGLERAQISGDLAALGEPAGVLPEVTIPEAEKNELTAAPCTPRAIGSEATISKLCFYTPITTWPKPPTPEGDGPHAGFFLSQRSEQVAKDMAQRFRAGKRAAGRAKNQAKILEQYGQDASS
ncbi:tRNA (guanine-N(7)-)-methyltransferase non-catalytic subunit trm82 [Malassezia cuniculi]|uniref:tRNA (Guanine-N(7)-)-methyltransferase non-catalytic subunit trm82 n=1 Tax=Malassezia cuniculi TaxID=948313 RepID=A0AAF0EVV9_9BASI|nr:tRNA (guanine-N(7)-)-methyltransferase non-catalytic subunit trm82 [Malassezia cuniculi]